MKQGLFFRQSQIEYLMKRIVVVQKVIAKTVGPLTPYVTKIFDAIKKKILSTLFNGMEVCGPEQPDLDQMTCIMNMVLGPRLVGFWALRFASRQESLVIGEHRKKGSELPSYPNNNKDHQRQEEEVNMMRLQMKVGSSGKLSMKGKSVRCGKYGNMGHNRKGCRGQGGETQTGGSSARNVSCLGSAKRTVGARNVSVSQPIAAQITSTGAKNASSQPSAAPSTTSQGPTQHSAGLRQGFQVAFDRYRDAFSVIYSIYAHS
ncbi:hypothetical protein Tco_1394546, partial [Tanacetum coccineum]